MSIPLGRLVKLQSEKYDAFTLFGMVPNSEPFQLSIDNLNEQDTERQVSRKNSCIAEESH